MIRWAIVLLVLAVVAVAGVVLVLHFHDRGTPQGVALLQPWDGQIDPSLIAFNHTASMDMHGFSPGMTNEGPMGSVEYHFHYLPADGRDLFEVKTARPAWIFWWDARGEPQIVARIDAPPMSMGEVFQHDTSWATAGAVGMRATVRSDAYPLRIMLIEPDKLAADQPRVQQFLRDALQQKLSDDQVVQIVEICNLLPPLDQASMDRLLDISTGKTPLFTLRVEAAGQDEKFGVTQTPDPRGDDFEHIHLRRRVADLVGRMKNGVNSPTPPGAIVVPHR